MKLKLVLLLTGIAGILAAPMARSQNLIQNGSFELDGTTGFGESGIPTGWTFTPGATGNFLIDTSVDNTSLGPIYGSFTAPDGNYYADFTAPSGSADSISQPFATVSGSYYEVSFYFNTGVFTGSTGDNLSIKWGNTTISVADPSFHSNLHSSQYTDWSLYDAILPASSSSTTLTITGDGGSHGNSVAVDNVSVTTSAVPEPASVGLVAIGAMAALAAARRRK